MSERRTDNIYLTVVIPVWNREREIARSLGSISKQVVGRPVEIIVVDVASTDDTCRVVREMIRQYPFVSLVELSSRQNAATARNAGLRVAHGEYVWFVDSDDYVVDGGVDCIWKALKAASPDFLRFDKVKDSLERRIDGLLSDNDNRSPVALDLTRNSRDLKFCLSMGSVWNAVYSRAVIGDVRFDETFDYGEDAVFTWSVALRARRGLYLPRPLYVYMRTPGSLTASKPSIRFVCYMRQVERFMSLIDNADIASSVKKELYSECVWRVYCHAFGCYEPNEIDGEMWKAWRHAYRLVLVENEHRGLVARLFHGYLGCFRRDMWHVSFIAPSYDSAEIAGSRIWDDILR